MPAKSKAQQKMMGMALAMKRGEMPMRGEAGKMAKTMTQKQLKDFASTPTKKLPEHKTKKK